MNSKYKIEFTLLANEDLNSIFEYISKELGADQAAKSHMQEFENGSYWKNWTNNTDSQNLTWKDDYAIQRFYFGDFFFSVINRESCWNNV